MRRTAAITLVILQYLSGATLNAAPPDHHIGEVQFAQNTQSQYKGQVSDAPIDLKVEANCDRVKAGQSRVVFSWVKSEKTEGKQRIDITPYRTGFSSEKYETVGELKPEQNSFEWSGGEPGINYFWRVLTLGPNGWVESDTARYEAPTCPVDFERPQAPPK